MSPIKVFTIIDSGGHVCPCRNDCVYGIGPLGVSIGDADDPPAIILAVQKPAKKRKSTAQSRAEKSIGFSIRGYT